MATSTSIKDLCSTNLTGLPLLKLSLFTNLTVTSVVPMTSSAGGETVGTAETVFKQINAF